MSKNKNQHYIPRVLLKRFLTPTKRGNHLYRFRRGGQDPEELSVSQAGAARYFYRDGLDPDNSDALDKVLLMTESRIGPILDELCNSFRVPAKGTESFGIMVRFIHDLYLRTPSMRAQLEAASPSQMRTILSDPLLSHDKHVIEDTLTKM